MIPPEGGINIKIEKISIQGIRSHKDTTFSVESYNTIVGENNSGKSNILFAIRWFFNELKIKKEDIKKGYDGNPAVKIIFVFDREKAPFNEEYAISEGKFEIEAFADLDKLEESSVGPKYKLKGKKEKDLKQKEVKNLVDVIFLPSIRKLDDEFKFTANSTITKLVSNHIIARIEKESPKNSMYKDIEESIKKLSDYMDGERGAFKELKDSLEKYMLDYKNMELEFKLRPPKIDELIRNSFEPYIELNGEELTVDSQGMGYQRSLIFSLICNMADIKVDPSKMVLYLIEEPEIFLHPNHQTYFRDKLTSLSRDKNNQIILTSHSPYFLSHVENYSQIKRVYLRGNDSILKELTNDSVDKIRKENGKLMAHAIDKVGRLGNETVDERAKKISEEDELRYLLWIDPLRANAFLSKKVILVEGPTEKAFFSFIFGNELGLFPDDERTSEISVIDTVGKFHFYKFAKLLSELDIPIWIMYDTDVDDNGKDKTNAYISHQKLNKYIESLKEDGTIKDCLGNHPNLEESLGLDNERSNKDISIYHKLERNDRNCRDSDKYKEIKVFVKKILDYKE